MATSPVNVAVPTPTTAPTPHESFVQKIEGVGKKVLTIMEAVGKDAQKTLTEVVKYLPEAATLADILFPAESAVTTGVVNAVSLIQQAVVAVEAKAALLPNGLTGAQKLADVMQLVGPAVTSLLAQEKITADNAEITKIVNAVVAILNVQTTTQA